MPGYIIGPALAAAAVLAALGAEELMAINGATFALSALVVARTPLDRTARPRRTRSPRAALPSCARHARASVR